MDRYCLCTPEESGKQQGIKKLKEIYTEATIVLVIDERLSQIKVKSMLKAKMQVLCCEWFSRLWTLQEGWLASDLRMQFSNVALSVDDILKTCGTAIIYPGWLGLDDELYKQLRPYFDKTAGAMSLMSLQRAMHGRRVKMETDEPICVATLLNLDLENFVDDTPSMDQIFGQVKLPEGLMWAESPHLTMKGIWWAPSTLLNQFGDSRLLDY